MKNLAHLFLNLLIIINPFFCFAMEKETVISINADIMLLQAAHNNNNADVIEALKNGTNVNAQDQDKNTALHKAIQHGNYELFEALCNGKLNPCITNKYDLYPIFYIDDKLDFSQQYNIVAFATRRAILAQMRYELKNNKKIKQINLSTVEDQDKLITLFNQTIGKKQKKFYCQFYDGFLSIS